MQAVNRYRDRFQAETYRDDVPVLVGLIRSSVSAEPEWIAEIPERLFSRIQAIARGYELHLLPVIAPDEETRLNSMQCPTLLEECALLVELVNDTLLREAVAELERAGRRCVAERGRAELLIEGP